MRKLPDCPKCQEDELWRVPGKELQLRCYLCGWDSGVIAAADWQNDVDALIAESVTKAKVTE